MNPEIFTRFQSKLGPESIAVWWTTTEDIHLKSDYLTELDYFFDGLITKSIRSSSKKCLGDLFLYHHHFGNPFYLIYSTEPKASDYLKQSLKLFHPNADQVFIHPLSVSSTILKEAKSTTQKTGFKLAPSIDETSL